MKPKSALPTEVASLLAGMPESVQQLALSARLVVLNTLACPVEVADAKAKVIGYGYGSGYKGLVATLILSKKGVKIGLVQGASLPDPNGLLQGAGKVHRYIEVSAPEHVRQAGVKQLLEAGLSAWRQRSNPANKKKVQGQSVT